MEIGYHELEGKIEKLKKPLAVLEKRIQVSEEEYDPPDIQDASEFEEQCRKRKRSKKETWYEVVGFIKRKIAFVSRPKASH